MFGGMPSALILPRIAPAGTPIFTILAYFSTAALLLPLPAAAVAGGPFGAPPPSLEAIAAAAAAAFFAFEFCFGSAPVWIGAFFLGGPDPAADGGGGVVPLRLCALATAAMASCFWISIARKFL